jgi:large subunit ribosomal protein L22
MGARKRNSSEKIKESRKTQAFAKLNSCPTSPRKMRLVADLVRGEDVYKALNILKFSGLNAKGIIASFMIASAVLSMWVMNTSTAIMLLPVGISVIKVITDTVDYIYK